MAQKLVVHLVLLCALVLGLCGLQACISANATGPGPVVGCPSTGYQYCVTDISGNVHYTVAGYNYNYSGNLTFTFSPSLPSSVGSVVARFNTGGMHGNAVANGSASLNFTISGQSLQCKFTNPTNVLFFSGTTVIATFTFTWKDPCS